MFRDLDMTPNVWNSDILKVEDWSRHILRQVQGWLSRLSSLKKAVLTETKMGSQPALGGFLHKQAAKIKGSLEGVLHKQAVLTKAKVNQDILTFGSWNRIRQFFMGFSNKEIRFYLVKPGMASTRLQDEGNIGLSCPITKRQFTYWRPVFLSKLLSSHYHNSV